jgi:hypothetical protein
MSQAGRQGLKALKVERRRAARRLRERQAAQGLKPRPRATIANGAGPWKTVAEEKQARQEAVEEQLKIYRAVLPTLLKRCAQIRDPRQAKTIRHKLTVLLLYGRLAFVFQMASRREANRDMTMPAFRENLRLLFPELESLPHQDTLDRLLAGLQADQLEETLVELAGRFIRKKKFLRYLVAN